MLEGAGDDRVVEPLAGLRLERGVDDPCCLTGVFFDPAHRSDVPPQQLLHDLGVFFEKLGAHEQHGRGEGTARPQVGLVDEHARTGVEDQAGHPRLGQPRAVEFALLEQGEGLRILSGSDVHIATAGGVGLEALVGEPAAQRDVLSVAELGSRDRRAGEVCRGVDAVANDEGRTAGGRSRDDVRGLASRLDERVDRRVRADVGRVDSACREGLDRGRSGVED